MAKVNITAWDVAEQLGLSFVSESYNSYEDICEYRFNGKIFMISSGECYFTNREEADEQAAQKVLGKLAELIVID